MVASSIANFCKNRMSDHAFSHQWFAAQQMSASSAPATQIFERDQHLARFEPARVPAHQRVEQKKIDRRDEAGREGKAAVSPPEPEREQPVEK